MFYLYLLLLNAMMRNTFTENDHLFILSLISFDILFFIYKLKNNNFRVTPVLLEEKLLWTLTEVGVPMVVELSLEKILPK